MPSNLLQLQRTLGNRATIRVLADTVQREEQGETPGELAPEGPEGQPKPVNTEKLKTLDRNIKTLEILHEWVQLKHSFGSTLKTEEVWKQLDDQQQNTYRAYYEAGSLAEVLLELIGKSRDIVKSLTAADVEEGALDATKAQYFQKLNTLSTYYTQMANMDILQKGDKSDTAWKRTCNVTSVAMALEALGVGADAFTGDKELLAQIANHFEPDRFEHFSDVRALRMPDVLQFVAIYLNMPDSGEFSERVEEAWNEARGSYVFGSNNFLQIAAAFGVTESSRFKTDWDAIKKKKKKAVETYKKKITAQVGPELDAGGQVIVNRLKPSKHFVRLESLSDDGITIDDPADLGKNASLSWKEAYQGRYFNTYVVLNK